MLKILVTGWIDPDNLTPDEYDPEHPSGLSPNAFTRLITELPGGVEDVETRLVDTEDLADLDGWMDLVAELEEVPWRPVVDVHLPDPGPDPDDDTPVAPARTRGLLDWDNGGGTTDRTID